MPKKKNEHKEINKELFSFIAASPSCYHTVSSAAKIFETAGFERLYEGECRNLKAGMGYFVIRNDSSVIAFRAPGKKPESFKIISSHSDSPCFKLKPNPELKADAYVTLNTEKYGGPLISPWFDRPLGLAGRVTVAGDGCIYTKLFDVGRDILMLPGLAIHMDRDANKGHEFKLQKELTPVFTGAKSGKNVKEMIARTAGVKEADIIDMDAVVYCRSAATVWGADEEFISAPRLDDLQCVYSAVKALCSSSGRETAVNICCIFNNEEVGSLSMQGADSSFLSDTLERIAFSFGLSRDEFLAATSKSFQVSADNGHSVHPNYPEKSDPANRPVMNGGVLIKRNASEKYTTDSVSAGIFKMICKKAGVPFQDYVNHSDIPGGSTLGNISNAHVSMHSVDIGAAQLAMHSPYESAGAFDSLYLFKAMKGFYEADICADKDRFEIVF
ncbi:MAG: M18 family aminopeptidase [Lachnospiraceae bacterium]|nr:M18 family aminopeptidase [Lachnospiraceae bacterium]